MNFWVNFLNTFDMARYKERGNRLSSYCPWSFFVGGFDEGIALLKSGALMRCYSFVCPDLGSASAESINSVSYYFNAAIKKLDSRWCIHFEARRDLTREYPRTAWRSEAGYLIDRRRKENFTRQENHFVNNYYLTMTCQLKSELYTKTKRLLYKKKADSKNSYFNRENCRKEIDAFRDETAACLAFLKNCLYVEPLNNDECASFLHAAVSSKAFPLTTARDRPMLFDHYLTDDDLDIGTTLKLGEYYIPVVSVRDFPLETYPAMFNSLNASTIEYRWVTRWISRSKEESKKDLEKYQARFYGSRKSWGTAFAETLGNYESGKYDPAAESFESDVATARVELSTDEFSFGYYTSNITVWDKDLGAALDKARYIAGLINSAGFGAKPETTNAFQAWLSMQPGNAFANARRPIVSSGNLSHIIPLSSIWSGMRQNRWTEECFGCSSPLLTCTTSNRIPFFLNLNIGDVGHTFIFGPTGAGKSTLLCLLETQFLKYRGANVIILDKDKSARSVTMAVGGSYAEPGGDDVAFQPLRDLETPADISWAAEFIKLLLTEQHLEVNAVMSEAIVTALKQLAADKAPGRRTITTFQQYVNYTNPKTQTNDIRYGLQPYTMGGEYGAIFDADNTSLSLSKWVMIEMGRLMSMGPQAVTPALMFIFHFIERIYTKPNGDPTGEPTLLVLDEAWLFLDNDYFARTIENWLVTLRKKKVFCVLATQEVARAANSRLSTTIISQCLTKIYLADQSAQNEQVANYYRMFGLADNEITALAHGMMKQDYFYKSPRGARMFELGLDRFQIALLSPDHTLLDRLEAKHGRNSGKPLVRDILDNLGMTPEYQKYLPPKKAKGATT